MKRPNSILLRSLLAFVGLLIVGGSIASSAYAQETTVASSAGGKGLTSKLPETKYVEFENPPLKLEAAGTRVYELQATLVRELRGKKIRLGPGSAFAPPKFSRPDEDENKLGWVELESQLRNDRRFKFLIHENWKPGTDDVGNYLSLPSENPLIVDGVYGQHTYAAVILFQLSRNLPITGEVDVVTLNKLEPMVPASPLLAWIMEPIRKRLGANVIGSFPSEENVPLWVKRSTAFIMTLLILAASLAVLGIARTIANSTHFLSKWLNTPTSSPWFGAFVKEKVFLRIAHFAPALFIFFSALSVFPAPAPLGDQFPYLNTFQNWHEYVSRLGLSYVSLVFVMVAFAIANVLNNMLDPDREIDNPINGIIRVSKRFIALVGIVLIGAALAGRNPFIIVGGLGAFMAVIILVFRDFLLGLVASIQIITHKVVKIGDWIAMPKYHADGDVTKMSLTLVSVQNFDKTISTIPTHAILSESFRNWTGMRAAGGRRIKRAVLIDIGSIQVCTPAMLNRFEEIELIGDYIRGKKAELANYNRERDVEASPVNSRQLTNIGTFRAYLEVYLRNHPGLSDEMTLLVRQLAPTENGLPIEIYAFCKETEWKKYEAIQADIFDHVLALLPHFELRASQEMSGINLDWPEAELS